ncbi:MAG: hypothetical protein ACO3KK_03780, partial [Ilumatobacteraceae bacterium]
GMVDVPLRMGNPNGSCVRNYMQPERVGIARVVHNVTFGKPRSVEHRALPWRAIVVELRESPSGGIDAVARMARRSIPVR